MEIAVLPFLSTNAGYQIIEDKYKITDEKHTKLH